MKVLVYDETGCQYYAEPISSKCKRLSDEKFKLLKETVNNALVTTLNTNQE